MNAGIIFVTLLGIGIGFWAGWQFGWARGYKQRGRDIRDAAQRIWGGSE